MKVRPIIGKSLLVSTLAASAILLPATAANATQVIPRPGPNQTTKVTYYKSTFDRLQGSDFAIGQSSYGSCGLENWGTITDIYTIVIIDC
ncbi:MAG: hypothetical protein M3Y42_09740 [Actinomycetota bacterium]|nr:hypothetical protein [Actinomycetota bacterium]